MTMNRRVVTDGVVFRVQYRASRVGHWVFYPGEHATREEAQAVVDESEAREAAEAPERWQEVR